MNYIGRIIVLLGLLALPVVAMAQNDDPQKKSEIKLGKLDVIYEDEEYPTWEGMEGDYQQEITAIDMNAQTISFTYSETLTNCQDYVNGDDPATMTVAVNIQNGEWETLNFQKKNTNRIK